MHDHTSTRDERPGLVTRLAIAALAYLTTVLLAALAG
jgi:hypothetical protein